MNALANLKSQPARRIERGLSRGRRVAFTYNGEPVEAFDGETIASALIAAGHWVFQQSPKRGEPRGVFCNIGQCHSCLVVVDGQRNVRACQTPVADGCRVQTQSGLMSARP